ncbi:MAG: hypothetical protein AAB605_03380 [Patescibacteria group bacterium]
MVRILAAPLLIAVLLFSGAETAQALSGGQVRVLKGIPHIAKVFAPIAGVKWQEFAMVLAGICAVESTCSPTYPHRTPGGGWSQYQGLFQMNNGKDGNGGEVRKAENDLQRMLPQIQQLAQSGAIPADAYQHFQEAMQAGQSMGSRDKRFHPEYGVILGAAKHIQINKQLAERYPGQPLHQTAGHLTAQFSGSVQEKIRRGAFGAPISSAEAWALGQNKVGGATVERAIESAGASWRHKIEPMMQNLAQVTNDMTLAPTAIEPFDAPPFRPGEGGYYPNVSHGPISELLESGFVQPNDPRVQENFPEASQGATPSQGALSGDSTGSSGTGSGRAAGSATAGEPYALTIVTQLKSAAPGYVVPLAWSSVGMKEGSCALNVRGGEPLVQGKNDGTQRFSVPASAVSGGVLVFEITCTSLSGTEVEKGVTITIE